jgi:hypothetical protein
MSSSSRKKLVNSFASVDEREEEFGNEVMNMELLLLALRSVVKCRACNVAGCVFVNPVAREGLASNMDLYNVKSAQLSLHLIPQVK